MSVKEVGSILHNSTWYWLASAFDDGNLWFVYDYNGAVISLNATATYGVRYVVACI